MKAHLPLATSIANSMSKAFTVRVAEIGVLAGILL